VSTIFVAIESIRSNVNALNKLGHSFDRVVLASSRSRAMEELATTAQTVDAVLIGIKEKITPQLLESMPRLRAIASISTGTDHIAIEAAEQRDIALLNAPGANSRAVAEHALTLALALTKQVFPGNRACRTGLDWAGLPHLPRRLSGQQVGLVGAGATARELIQLLRPFKCLIKISTRDAATHSDLSDSVDFCSLEELFSVCSVVSLHLPLTSKTLGLIDGKLIKRLPEGAILINVSRLKLFDIPSVLAALDERADIRLGIDDLSLKEAGFCKLGSDRILTTPHVAGLTVETLRRMEDIVVDKLVGLFHRG
jgi:D-3-phosphoglycerate dehydrogenase